MAEAECFFSDDLTAQLYTLMKLQIKYWRWSCCIIKRLFDSQTTYFSCTWLNLIVLEIGLTRLYVLMGEYYQYHLPGTCFIIKLLLELKANKKILGIITFDIVMCRVMFHNANLKI